MSNVKMKGFKRLERAYNALSKYLKALKIKVIDAENVMLEDALGRVLAEDVVAPIDIPSFDRAAMDGYAVRSSDVRGASPNNPVILKIIGEASAGKAFKGRLGKGETVRISTGAPMPEGADAVVMLEYAEEKDGYVEVIKEVVPGENVSEKGEDVRAGEVVLEEGTILEPQDLAILASLGIKKVKVRRRPRVFVMACGNELVDLVHAQLPLPPGKIVETNRLMIMSSLKKIGAEPIDGGIVGDDISEIMAAISSGLKIADAVVISGGTSVGKGDVVPDAILSLGGKIIVHGVAISPGKPVALCEVKGKPVICLPGYPVAAFIGFLLFVRPLIDKLLRIRGIRMEKKINAVLSKRVPSKTGIMEFVRVSLVESTDGLIAEPIRITGAGVLSSLSKADGFLVVPEDVEGFEAGSNVEVVALRDHLRRMRKGGKEEDI